MKGKFKECPESRAVTRRSLRYPLTSGKVIVDNLTLTTLG